MKKKILPLLGILLFCSHDMYLKMDTYFLEPHEATTLQLYNGTFQKSDNVIDRDRMLDASLLGNGERLKIEDQQWSEKDSITLLNFETGAPGTWVVGVSTKARNIAMSAEDFNGYLEHDGVLDMLKWRKENNAMEEDAVEKYSKHVKAIFQVGDKTSEDWSQSLGYPIEFIPLSNPYEKHTGDQLAVKLLFQGKPLPNQLVYADYAVMDHHHSHKANNPEGHSHDDGEEHSHGEESHSHSHDGGEEHSHAAADNHEADHVHTGGQQLRTDANGVLTVDLNADGIWYLRTIHLAHSDEEGLTHESNWATLTFEVVHSHEHGHDTDGHSHEHEEDGIPSYLFWIGSLLIIGGLFLWFNRKKQ